MIALNVPLDADLSDKELEKGVKIVRADTAEFAEILVPNDQEAASRHFNVSSAGKPAPLPVSGSKETLLPLDITNKPSDKNLTFNTVQRRSKLRQTGTVQWLLQTSNRFQPLSEVSTTEDTVSIKNIHSDFENCDRASRHCCEKNHVCEVCSKVFPYRKSLKSHMELQHNEGPVRNILCTLCGSPFPSKLKLQTHMGCAHKTKVKKYVCKCCDFKTHAKNVSTGHERAHIGEKPGICACCGNGFNTKQTLKNHKISHTGKKPHN